MYIPLPHSFSIVSREQYRCKFCKEESTYAAITGNTKGDTKELKVPPEKGHYAECPAYPLQCGNMGCSKEMKRADMQQHAKDPRPKHIAMQFHEEKYISPLL